VEPKTPRLNFLQISGIEKLKCIDDILFCCKLEAISNSNPKGNLLFSSGGKLHD
jgi:hypothetical protein